MEIDVTFVHPDGTDWTGLTPTVNIYDTSDSSLVVNGGSVSEIAEGAYKYVFSGYDASKNYFWKMDAGVAVPSHLRYKRGFSEYAGAIPDAQAGESGGIATIDNFNSDTRAEPGQGAPLATTTPFLKLDWLYKFWRNSNKRNASEIDIYNDAGNVVDQKASISDDGTTFTKGKYESGP